MKPIHNEVKDFSTRLIDELESRFENIEFEQIYSKTTILDPRFKKNDFLKPTAVSRVFGEINDYLKHCQPARPVTRAAASIRSAPNISDIFSYRKIYQRDTESNVVLEFKNYLESKLIPWETNSDPLLYWTNNFSRDSELSKLALKYLIIPATSVPSERLFSKAGDILKKRRSNLSPKRVEQLMIISCLSADLIASL